MWKFVLKAVVIGAVMAPVLCSLLRYINLRFRWQARRSKLSELYDIMVGQGIDALAVSVMSNQRTSSTVGFGSSIISYTGRNGTHNVALPRMYLSTRFGHRVILFKRSLFDFGDKSFYRNIIVLSKNSSSYWAPLFGLLHSPEKIIQFALNKTLTRIGPNAYLDRRRLDSLLTQSDYLGIIEESHAQPVQTDDRGQLYKFTNLPSSVEEPLTIVKFEDYHINTTYAHRVPPDMDTATEAVAWMFGKRPEEYRPAVES